MEKSVGAGFFIKVHSTRLCLLAILLIACLDSFGQQRRHGAVLANPDEFNAIATVASPFSGKTTLTNFVDLSPLLPPPGNQGNQGSCVGWAVAYGLKTYQQCMNTNWPPVADEKGKVKHGRVFSPAFIYNQINQNRDQGSKLLDALELLKSDGCATWSDFPYDDQNFTRKPDRTVRDTAKPFRISRYDAVKPFDEEGIKIQLSAGYPIVFGAYIDAAFENLQKGDIWRDITRSIGRHAMLLVGYDDKRAAYKILNSWGAEWCDSGFGWISYNLFPRVVAEAYVCNSSLNDVRPRDEPDTPVQVPSNPVRQGATIQFTSVDTVKHQSTTWYTIGVRANIPAFSGKWAQVVVKFYYENGDEPIRGLNPAFTDKDGNLTTSTKGLGISPQNANVAEWEVWIPVQEVGREMARVLNSSNGSIEIGIEAQAELFVDNYRIATASNPIQIKYGFRGNWVPGINAINRELRRAQENQIEQQRLWRQHIELFIRQLQQ